MFQPVAIKDNLCSFVKGWSIDSMNSNLFAEPATTSPTLIMTNHYLCYIAKVQSLYLKTVSLETD